MTPPDQNKEETDVSNSDKYERGLIGNWQWLDKLGLRKSRNESTCLSWSGSINQYSDKPYNGIELAETPIDVRNASVFTSKKISNA